MDIIVLLYGVINFLYFVDVEILYFTMKILLVEEVYQLWTIIQNKHDNRYLDRPDCSQSL